MLSCGHLSLGQVVRTSFGPYARNVHLRGGFEHIRPLRCATSIPSARSFSMHRIRRRPTTLLVMAVLLATVAGVAAAG